MTNKEFAKTEVNRIQRVPKNAAYDTATIYDILDDNLIGNVAFASPQGLPFVIPMLFARQADELFFHGSTKSRLMNQLCSGQTVCVSVTIVDGLVMAKSLFHHSMNYRSVCVFGKGYEVTDERRRMEALKTITDKTMPGRWDDARLPNAKELKATCIAAIQIETASAKIRTGPPNDDTEDMELPVWSGVIPISLVAEHPVAAESDDTIPIPSYMQQWVASNQ